MPAVNPRILEWARSTAGLSEEEASRSLGFATVDRLTALESGVDTPSRATLLKMSKQYRRSLLTFYLAQPPKKGDRGQDFRTINSDRSPSDDALLDALIRDITARQSVVRATLREDEEQSPLAFIGSTHMQEGAHATADSIAKTLQFDVESFRRCSTGEAAFTYLRERAESIGIFVLLVGNLGSHHSAISVKTFRGFTISDSIAPFIVINDQDAKTAWSFTLLHEIAHLWLGTTGVSGAYADSAIERFCNDVAGEILLPASDLVVLARAIPSDVEKTIAAISEFAGDRNIRRRMVAYKLYRTGALEVSTWRSLDNRIHEMWVSEKARSKQNQSSDSGPNYYVVRRHRLGKALLEFANRNVSAGTLSPVKAARVLGVKPRSVYPLLDNLSTI